jgi:enolase
MEEKIKSIKARKILDSRGNWTIEVLAKTENFSVRAGVPSGASVGRYEAKIVEIEKAIKNVNEIIGSRLKELEPRSQKEIDKILIELDGTGDKSNLGANAIVGTSIAVCKLGAKIKNIPLWRHLKEISGVQQAEKNLPKPCFNIINGGEHAGNNLAVQEFMIVPGYDSFSKNLKVGVESYHRLKKIILQKIGRSAINVGDEGGFAPPISSVFEALDLLEKAIDKETKIILDCAASQFYKEEGYHLEGATFTREGLLSFYEDLIKKHPIIGLEDPFDQDDFEGWQKLTSNSDLQALNFVIIGDDLLVTNPERIKIAQEKNLCNGAIIKINQIGTVTEAIEAAELAKSYGWKIVVSHRSGETCDDFISDFAIGIGADFIKTGAPARGERVAKYNRLLEIEEEFKKF